MTTTKAGSDAGPAFGDSVTLSSDTAVWIVRHGETEWSVSGQHTGVTDIPLTPAGERQAAALRELLADAAPVFVLSSPRSRALETARLGGIEVNVVDDELVEWDYGDYEGMTTPEIREHVPDWTVWTHGCPGGESVADVQARADRVLTRVIKHLGDGPVMVFGHGHFSRALGARWIGLPVSRGANLLLGTAAPSVLGAEHGAPALDRWNLTNPAA